jgi:hypothetical protein
MRGPATALIILAVAICATAQDVRWTAEPAAPGTTAPTLSTDSVMLSDTGTTHIAWTGFPPLSPANGLTFSARLTLDRPMRDPSGNQLRWYLLGRDGMDWKGLAVVAGRERGMMQFILWACPGTRSNFGSWKVYQTVTQQVISAESPPAGSPVRLVTSVRQHPDGTCDVGGLLGTTAFEFKGVQSGMKLPELSNAGLMVGSQAGVSTVTVSRVRIEASGP